MIKPRTFIGISFLGAAIYYIVILMIIFLALYGGIKIAKYINNHGMKSVVERVWEGKK